MTKPIKTYFSALLAVAFVIGLGACSAQDSPMSELCKCYEEIAVNNQKVAEAFRAVYEAPRDKQEALQAEAQKVSEEIKAKNEALVGEAKKAAEALQGAEMKCEASPAVGYTVEKSVFSTVTAQDKFANIVMEITTNGAPAGTPCFLFYDKDGKVVYKTMGMVSDGKIALNFRITTNKGPEMAQALGSVEKLMIVTPEEYKAGGADMSATPSAAPAEESAVAESQEPEPAFEGAPEADTEGVKTDEIKKGDNLVETLKRFKNVSFDYNVDYGVTANVGKYWIVIPDDALTAKGQEIINAIPSDMENNISFSLSYIKPTAKVGEFHKN